MLSLDDLRRTLTRIDGRGYKAYKDLVGSYDCGAFALHIDHVQGDPFASPSMIRVRVAQCVAELPPSLFDRGVRRVALEDFLTRTVRDVLNREARGSRGSGRSGLMSIDAGGQEVLQRTAVVVTPDWVEARLQVGLPARGRTVLGQEAQVMLCRTLPTIVENGLRWANLPPTPAGWQRDGRRFVECVENQEHIRSQLDGLGLVAFIADGAILPRESGASERPLASNEAVRFRAPDPHPEPRALALANSRRLKPAAQGGARLRVTVCLANPIDARSGPQDRLTGLGIPKGVTLIVGGGYHGKSTLLRAIERGVYPHIPGDGREYVVTCPDAVKIRAEDGRRVERVDISPFISNLPLGRRTDAFCSDDASGSTSQAANILEATEVGATVLLLDEDTSATNFMVRDARMQALVHKEHEPITPFVDRAAELYEKLGVSTILVMGGCGDYFDVADTVIMMRDYQPADVGAEARRIKAAYRSKRSVEVTQPLSPPIGRVPLAESFDASRGRREVKIDVKSLDRINYGSDPIDLRCVEQLVDSSQTRAVGYAIYLATRQFMDGAASLREVVEAVERFFQRHGLDGLDPFHHAERHPGNFARPRKYEIAAAINRLRSVRMRQRKRANERE